jgi:hypothetical protein
MAQEQITPVKGMRDLSGKYVWTGKGDANDPSTWEPAQVGQEAIDRALNVAGGKQSAYQSSPEMQRQLGLTARAGIEGTLAIPGMLADAPFRLANLAGANTPLPSQKQSELLTRLGLPEPQGAQERLVQDIAGGAAGTGALSKVSKLGALAVNSPQARGMLEMLARNPEAAMASGALASGVGGAVREMGGGPGAQMAAGLATGARMPSKPGAGSMRAPGREMELQTFKEGKALGYKVPPSRIEETIARDAIESMGGKAAIKQKFSIENQEVTNRIAKQEAGLQKNQDLSESNLESARYDMAEPYRQAAALSTRAKTALEGMNQSRAEAKLQWKYYKTSMLPDAKQQAEALDAKADAYSRVLEKEAQANNKPDLVKEIREARVKIAKNHQVERALNLATGDVDARIIGREFDKTGSKAMTGGLRTVGKVAQAFGPFMGERPSIPTPGVSHLDFLVSTGLGAGGGGLGYASHGLKGALMGAAPGLMWPLARKGARGLAGSPMLQRPLSEGQGIPIGALAEFIARQDGKY